MEPEGISDPDFVPKIIEPLSLGIPDDALGCQWLIGHADRFWKAEESNATRIAARANLVLSGILAIIGLKLYSAGKELETMLSPSAGLLGRWSLALCAMAFVMLLASLAMILSLKMRKSTRGPASGRLVLDPALVKKPWRMTERQSSWYVFKKTHNAAEDLHERNNDREKVVDTAQLTFFLGVIALFIALVLYTAIVFRDAIRKSDSGKQPDRGSDHGGDSLKHQGTPSPS